MKRRTLLQSLPAVAVLPAANWVVSTLGASSLAGSQKGTDSAMPANATVYELRVYHAAPGKLPELLTRFREHTIQLFDRHGMKSVAYWTPLDEPEKNNTLVYILRHPSRDAAAANWKAFQDDAEWKSVREKSEANGKLVEKVDSTFMALTDFSPRLWQEST
jgi:NIPSNAP